MPTKTSLSRRGLQVATCDDGLQVLARWRATSPEVVVLDLSLPGLDGLQVLQQAREAGLAAPVLILTARGTVGDRVLGLNAGADDYLPKPFDLDELEARLRALGRRLGDAPAEPRLPVGADSGFIVVFDDISDVITAQRSVAWGEVARRLAHEVAEGGRDPASS